VKPLAAVTHRIDWTVFEKIISRKASRSAVVYVLQSRRGGERRQRRPLATRGWLQADAPSMEQPHLLDASRFAALAGAEEQQLDLVPSSLLVLLELPLDGQVAWRRATRSRSAREGKMAI
jgi:hypothetical protein